MHEHMTFTVASILSLLLVFVFSPERAGAQPTYVGLSASQSDTQRLDPTTPAGVTSVVVDSATELQFVIRSTSSALSTGITGPGGQFIDPTTVASFGGTHSVTTEQESGGLLLFVGATGTTQTYVLPSLGPGTYDVNFSYPGVTPEEVVSVDLFQDSLTQAGLFLLDRVVVAGGSATVTAAVFDDNVPVVGASVILLVQAPGLPLFSIGMVDDGQGLDVQAGDGLYNAAILTPVPGEYTAAALIVGANGGGLPFARTVGMSFSVADPVATFSSTNITDQGIDDNANGLFDRIEFATTINSTVAGEYIFTVSATTATGQDLSGQGTAMVGVGNFLITADLMASEVWFAGEDGPYVIDEATLTFLGPNGAEDVALLKDLSISTQGYQVLSFDRPALEFSGNNSDQGRDTDGDGDFDFLDVTLGINVVHGGSYDVKCELWDSANTEIQTLSFSTVIPQNVLDHPLVLSFPGEAIRAYGVDGPFTLKNFEIKGQGEALRAIEPYTTSTYGVNSFNQQQGSAMFLIAFNDTALKASDLHITFEGAQGSVIVDPNLIVGGCANPSIPSNPPSVTNTVVIDWGSPCVEIGSAVALIVKSDYGPLRFQSGYWSGPGGVNIGNLGRKNLVAIEIDLSGCVGPATMRIERACVPQGTMTCGPLVRRDGYKCWWRWCCFPEFLYWFRVRVCCATTRLQQTLGLETCFYSTPWVPGHLVPGYYGWLRVTNPTLSELPVPGLPPGGHFPNNPILGEGFVAGVRTDVSVAFRDAGGETWRPGVSFASTFSQLSEALRLTSTDTELYEGGYVPMLHLMAPRYFVGADLLADLQQELNLVYEETGEELALELLFLITTMQQSMYEMASMFMPGVIYSDAPFADMDQAMRDLSALLRNTDSIAGLDNAADTLDSLAKGFECAAEMVLGDLEDPIVQDFFLWGLNNRFELNVKHLGSAFGPHDRISVSLPQWAWFASTIDAVQVKVQDRDTLHVNHQSTVHMSDRSEFDVPIAQTKPRNIWFKLPTHLSRVVEVQGPGMGKTVVPEPLIAGDINNDNVIDMADLDIVVADYGLGGADAEEVPPSDVNADGHVGWDDIIIVWNNVGKVGEELNSLPPPYTPADPDRR